MESPEILAQCALDAAGSSIIRLPADSTHSNRLGLETLNVNQKLLRLLLDHVREVAQPKHVQQILNFRHPMENPGNSRHRNVCFIFMMVDFYAIGCA